MLPGERNTSNLGMGKYILKTAFQISLIQRGKSDTSINKDNKWSEMV
jgi:hypothetical protein